MKKITLAFPHRTSVPIKAILLLDVRSPFIAAGWGEVHLEHGVVSPVKLDSSIERSIAFENKQIKLKSYIMHSTFFKW